ncbi:hypothetical protein [Halobacillus campisalis]|uniref:DUF2283 domain-containing protein n=1 Tax=Halobacillus campisalis TaxID=435909 RepID=A0ABW2K9V5_9BACI|nr:hypothetical protein [Halobacillus campisalis]
MNIYVLDRYEDTHAILIQKDLFSNEIMILKDRLIEFAKPGDTLSIDFDQMGNLRHVEIILKHSEEAVSDLEGV